MALLEGLAMGLGGGLLAGTTYHLTNWALARALAPLRRRLGLPADRGF